MKKVIVASTHEEAGKTSIIIGLAKALTKENKKCGYMKPIGDRLLYQKKRLWDYDAALVSSILNLEELPENVSMGFDHTKLKYMYNENSTKEKLKELCSAICQNKDIVFIEGGKNLSFGQSVFLNPQTVTNTLEGELLLILSGDENDILDEITFLTKCVLSTKTNLLGVIINQIKDVKEFEKLFSTLFSDLGVTLLGIIPFEESLTRFTMDYLYQTLLAKVIAGENGLANIVHHTFVGAMSADQVVTKPLWNLENKLIITPGDRSDMILAALESNTSGILLTNNIFPDDPIIKSIADRRNIPILLVPQDTFTVAKLIDDMEILFTKEEKRKIKLLERLVKENIDLDPFLN
ncbi:MAG: DRTGG domain-containing protein [Candidatus Hodarchaeales archaeon]|jgi:BioD-like phosphotransacetylase family protein